MRRSHLTVLVAVGVLFSLSCSDQKRGALPTSPFSLEKLMPSKQAAPVPGTCTTQNALEAEINAVFAPGKDRGTVHGDVGKLRSAINNHDDATAHALAFSITDFIIQKFKANQVKGTPAQVTKLVNDVFCYAGLAITITDPANSSVVNPSPTTQTITNNGNTAGTQLPPNSLTETTVLEFVRIPDTFGGGGHGPLNTKLDQYSGFFVISAGSASNGPPAKPVIVGVCPAPGMDPVVRGRLRLGHQALAGFEITPVADANFLQCPTQTAQLDRLPRWLRSLASLVMPTALYARQEPAFSGGVGGTAGEFSPFDPVDPLLSFSGGVGGTAGEFKKSPVPQTLGPQAPAKTPRVTPNFLLRPGSTGSRLTTVVDGVCTAVAAPWGMPLEPECRPGIVIRTHLGTVLENVPVAWAVTSGGGAIAPEASGSRACGAFGSIAPTATDVNGRAGVCWTLGSALGTNTVSATPSVGGDAPAGVTFVPATTIFTATAIKRTPVATATGATVTFDGLDHPGSGTCSDGLTPALSYSGGSVPHNVGVYTLTVTCGDGNVLYNTVTATATITITALRVAGVGANGGLRAGNTVFSSGDLPGTITRLTTSSFNLLSPDSLRKLFDVLIITWDSPGTLDVDWATRLRPYLLLGGGVIFDGDPNNIGDLSAIVSTTFTIVGGESPAGISVTTPVAGLTDGITGDFANNHIRFATFPVWDPALSPFLAFTSGPNTGAVVGLYGRFGAGCIVLTGPDQDFHAFKGGNTFETNQYNFLVNEIRFVRSCP